MLTGADEDDHGFYIKNIMADLVKHSNLEHASIVYSKSLFQTITTVHENRDYLLGQTVQNIRGSFESRNLSAIRWVHTFSNIADV